MRSTSLLLILSQKVMAITTDRFAATITDDRHDPVVIPRNNTNANPTKTPSGKPTRKPTLRKPITPSVPRPTSSPTRLKAPTKKPINAPSNMPSKKLNAPSSQPVTPTGSPVTLGIVMPTRTPTSKQKAPTKKPLSLPTGAPITLLILTPTRLPTDKQKAPTKKPLSLLTGAPISNPAQQPTSSLQIKTSNPSVMPASSGTTQSSQACQSQGGNFGQVTANPLVVKYNYRMDLATADPDKVLQSLEVAISDTLVKSLVSTCSGGSSNFFSSKVSVTSSSQVLGIFSAPPDKIISSKYYLARCSDCSVIFFL